MTANTPPPKTLAPEPPPHHIPLSGTRYNLLGNLVKREEWFLVPLHVIDEAVQRIRDGAIAGMRYEPGVGGLVEQE